MGGEITVSGGGLIVGGMTGLVEVVGVELTGSMLEVEDVAELFVGRGSIS